MGSGRSRHRSERGPRVVALNERGGPNSRFADNTISNTKYTALTFLPLNMAEQFGMHMNRYFLLIACLQLVRSITPVHPASTWGPLCFIFAVSALKEALDDLARARDDAYANTRPVALLTTDGALVRAHASELRVGDLVLVRDGDEVPADILLLATAPLRLTGGSGMQGVGVVSVEAPPPPPSAMVAAAAAGVCNGSLSVRANPLSPIAHVAHHAQYIARVTTANLDGEADLKTRHAVGATRALSLRHLAALRGSLTCGEPDAHIGTFDAALELSLGSGSDGSASDGKYGGGADADGLGALDALERGGGDLNSGEERIPVSADNLLLQGTRVVMSSATQRGDLAA